MQEHTSQPDPATMTSTDLLQGLGDPDNGAVWDAFVGRYRTVIVNYARRFAATADDAEDIAQEALAAFAESYRQGKYDRDKGRLRDWLFGIVRRQLRNWYRRQRGREIPVGGLAEGVDFLEQIEGEDQLRSWWDAQCRSAVLELCLRRARREVQTTTWDAFDLFACRNWPAARVAEELGITEDAVFGAKRRVLRRIRELRPTVECEW